MDIIFTSVFNMSIAASMLIIAVILLRLIFKNVPKWIRCVLWLFVALRLVIPISFESPFSLVLNAQTINSTSNSSVSYVSSSVNSDSLNTIHDVNIIEILSYIWVVGFTVMLIYMFYSYWRLHLKIRESVVIKDNIIICDRISSPFVFGIIKPRIYLPSNLSEEERLYVLAHEQEHINHHDNLWKPLGYLILSIHFFNPICWVAFKLFTNDIELACDERVIRNFDTESKKGYSNALLSCSIKHSFLSACPFSFGESGLKQRIKNVLGYKKPTFRIAILSFAVCLLTVMSFMTNPITSVLKIHSDSQSSAINNLRNVYFNFAEIPTTVPVTESAIKPTEPKKDDIKEEESVKSETVTENESSEEFDNDTEISDDYDYSYSDESYQEDSNTYDPVADNLVPITPFDYESTQKYNEQVSDAYREINEQIEQYERINYQPEPSAEEKAYQSMPDLQLDYG